MSGRKVELDEVIVPSPELECSSSQKSVPMMPTPISEEANDDDHETSDQVTTEHVGQAEYGPHQSGTVMLFWRSCYLTMTNLQTMRKRR